MKTKPCHLEIIAVLLLSVIPWPGPTVFKISCPRDRASVVRRIVQKRWMPILNKYQVELPLECPFHESRDIFHPQQAAKFQHRTSQWTCGLCGKSFYAEKHLDAHFDSRHKSNINMAEDAVCLANYCDIMRCDVLGSGELDNSLIDDDPAGFLNTDIQVWRESISTDSGNRRNSYSSCECRDAARLHKSDKSEIVPGASMTAAISSYGNNQRHCKQRNSRGTPDQGSSGGSSKNPALDSDLSGSAFVSSSSTSSPSTSSSTSSSPASSSSSSSSTSSKSSSYVIINGPENESSACRGDSSDEDESDDYDATNLVESSLPAAIDKRERSKEFEIRKLKSNCRPEELQRLKLQCEILVRDCISGLLANLSVKDFQDIEGELNRAICWYLSCDRYWEDSRRQPRHTPWYLLITFLFVLTTSISACYYVISIILTGSGEDSIDSNEENHDSNDVGTSDRASSVLLHDAIGGDPRHDDHRRRIEIGEDRLVAATGEMPDHYIYVAYPPELKRRLLESCYNRTTRL